MRTVIRKDFRASDPDDISVKIQRELETVQKWILSHVCYHDRASQRAAPCDSRRTIPGIGIPVMMGRISHASACNRCT